jgi:hypothetical protein
MKRAELNSTISKRPRRPELGKDRPASGTNHAGARMTCVGNCYVDESPLDPMKATKPSLKADLLASIVPVRFAAGICRRGRGATP